jgi:stearoyl-CoA desaturase (delta-9 desaturase)
MSVDTAQLLDPVDEVHQAPVDVSRDAPRKRTQDLITAFILVAPFVGVMIAAVTLFGRGVTVLELGLGVAFYAIAGHGATAGYHRMAAHRSFVATRGAKIGLCLAGSLAFEGGVISWVANHRRHHAFTDVAGDPHSPHIDEHATWTRTRGLIHAHVGWLFSGEDTDTARWAPDLLVDRDLVVIDRLFPVMCVVSLGVPALLAWAITGTWAGAVGGFVWGGLVRVFLLHHATFGVNSACHIWGTRPFKTRHTDRSTNFAPLAVLAMGESWHNLHHSNPTFARHGVERGQLDSTARVIRLLERTGRISQVRWPSEAAITTRRKPTAGPDRGIARQLRTRRFTTR